MKARGGVDAASVLERPLALIIRLERQPMTLKQQPATRRPWRDPQGNPMDIVWDAIRDMMAKPIYSGPLALYVSPVVFDLGEEECRRVCGVGPDVEIVEELPRKRSGETWRLPRVYLSAARRR